jgi:hypothetical protein
MAHSRPASSIIEPQAVEEYAAPLHPFPTAKPSGHGRSAASDLMYPPLTHQRSRSLATPYTPELDGTLGKAAPRAARPLSAEIEYQYAVNARHSTQSRPSSIVLQQPGAHTGMMLTMNMDTDSIGASVGGGEGGPSRREALHAVGLAANDEETCEETGQTNRSAKAVVNSNAHEGWRPHGYREGDEATLAREIAEDEARERGCCAVCCGRGGEGAQATCSLCVFCFVCFSLLGQR